MRLGVRGSILMTLETRAAPYLPCSTALSALKELLLARQLGSREHPAEEDDQTRTNYQVPAMETSTRTSLQVRRTGGAILFFIQPYASVHLRRLE